MGIGISGIKSGTGHRAKDYLDNYVAAHFPDGKTIEHIVGGVSVCRPLGCTVTDGLMIVGDAARVVDPLTGGGIYNAMFTGDLAVNVAIGARKRGYQQDCPHALRHQVAGVEGGKNHREELPYQGIPHQTHGRQT